ncbi:hypothetical protein QFZ77_004648 [Paenibacillus sp. V4I3]|nr:MULTISPECIES: hypothetical protein [unclassified Paenibacillus]MDQ0875989.1 hypothetical protein [Paenibacillus sp. V4I3]MDQ0887995.1 hypothetical protein [Paenibacillus sp. V4I9]
MKKRFSVGKAEWSDTKEEQYRKDSLVIAFGFGDETWLKLKDFYGV